MAELDLSPAVRADLVEIRHFSLEQFGPDVADRYYRGFAEAFNLLANHPFAGSEKQGIGKGVRCLMYRKHRIFYVVEGNTVLIVRIIHHARNAKGFLKWAQ